MIARRIHDPFKLHVVRIDQCWDYVSWFLSLSFSSFWKYGKWISWLAPTKTFCTIFEMSVFFFHSWYISVMTEFLFFALSSQLCSCYSYICFLLSIFVHLLLSYCFPFNLQVNALYIYSLVHVHPNNKVALCFSLSIGFTHPLIICQLLHKFKVASETFGPIWR